MNSLHETQIEEWIKKCEKMSLIKRLWQKDPTLWTKDTVAHKEIKERLGWLDSVQAMKSRLPELEAFKTEVREKNYSHAVLLGMGGSSLAAEVLQTILQNAPGHPELFILDSTDPARVKDIEERIELSKTLFIVSSKSGGTIELMSSFKYFFDRIKKSNA